MGSVVLVLTVNDGLNVIVVQCACNLKEVEVMQWQIEVDVLRKDMDIVQQRCHHLVTLFVTACQEYFMSFVTFY